MQQVSEPRYAIGQQFTARGKACTITDILKTYNNAGQLVKVRYVSQHEFCGQLVSDFDVLDVTIAKGILTTKGA